MLRLARPAVLAASLFLLGASPQSDGDAAAADPSVSPAVDAAAEAARAAFYDVLDQSARLMGGGRWDKAREALLAALAEHGAADYVLIALPGVQEDLRRCAFWSSYERPEPEDVVAGELVSWNPRKGQIKLRYALGREERNELVKRRRGTRKLPFESDFVERKSQFIHPLLFQGPHSIEIRCGPLGTLRPNVWVCREGDEVFAVVVGNPSGVVRQVGGSEYVEDWTNNSIPTDERLRVEVDVRDRKISLSVNGKTMTSCTKDKDRWGMLAFSGFADVEEVIVSGEVQTSWIEGLVDAAVVAARAEFDEGYDPLTDLPLALREHARESVAEDEGWFEVPGRIPLERAGELERVEGFIEEGEWDKALAYAESLPGEELAPLKLWLAALARLVEGKAAAAREELRALAELEPAFWPARQMLANLRADTGPRTRSLAEARQLVDDLPEEPRARVLLAQFLMMSGRMDEAQATLDAAFAAGLASPELDQQRRVLAQAVRGPKWAKTYEYVTAHYEIRSDISRDLCFEAGQALEAMYKKLDVNFRRIDDKKGRFRVFLFSGRGGYLAYAGDVMGGGHEQSAGMFSSVLKQLLIWNLPDRDSMLTTVRHEGFHQVFDQIVDHAPRWLNEGLAEYFELSHRVGGRWKDGVVNSQHVLTLQKFGTIPLEAFLYRPPQAFYANMRQSYAQGWALVHFLLESGPEERKRFDALLDGLIAGEETEVVTARLFPAADLADLDRRLREHVEALAEE